MAKQISTETVLENVSQTQIYYAFKRQQEMYMAWAGINTAPVTGFALNRYAKHCFADFQAHVAQCKSPLDRHALAMAYLKAIRVPLKGSKPEFLPPVRIETIADFAQACKTLHPDEIYELFEEVVSDDLRNLIYKTYASDSPEPFRAACIAIGKEYGVRALIKY